MRKSALRFLILTSLIKVDLCTFYGRNIYVSQRKTWSEARKYCRTYHTDLPSITNLEEDRALYGTSGHNWDVKAWIGLYKDGNDTWMWSGGKIATYFNWGSKQSTNEEDTCVVQNQYGWYKMNCDTNQFDFYCFDSNLVLVKEKKTWEQALVHCRKNHHNLVNLRNESALIKTLQSSSEAQTDHVWTGLRYLDDHWIWMKNIKMKYQAWGQGKMPQCNAWTHKCGALSLDGKHWDSWDCVDKLNFVCY